MSAALPSVRASETEVGDANGPRKSRRTRWGQAASSAEVKLGDKSESSSLISGHEDIDSNSQSLRDSHTRGHNQEDNQRLTPQSTPGIAAPPTSYLPSSSRTPSSKTPTTVLSSSRILNDVASRAAAARAALEKAKKALALQKQIQEQVTAMKTGKTGSIMMSRGANALVTAGVAAALRAMPQFRPMRFDRLGREVDSEGKVIDIKPVARSTLKVNINKEREAKLKQVVFQARVDRNLTNPSANPWFDPNLNSSGTKLRNKGLSFVEKGFYAKKERQMRAREHAQGLGLILSNVALEEQKRKQYEDEEKLQRVLQYQRDQNETESSLSTMNINSMNPNLVPLQGGQFSTGHTSQLIQSHHHSFSHSIDPSAEDDHDDDDLMGVSRRQEALHILQRRQIGIIPDIEWWDQPLLRRQAESDRLEDEDPDFPYVIAEAAITDLVEHPVPIEPVVDRNAPAPLTLHLTPKERTKLRRRKRQEREKDKQDKIRMGLLPPPAPKVKLANLMRVLGTSAVADPSRIERQVKEQMAERLRGHQERNEARRLDAESKRKKTISKWTQPSSEAQVPAGGAETCVFSIKDLSNRGHLFKVDKNAQQFHVTGAAIICPQIGNLIIAEGSRKALRGYKKLLLRRIKWSSENSSTGDIVQPFVGSTADKPTGSTINDPSDNIKSDEEETITVLKGRGSSYCRLLWEGVVKDRAFKQWKVYVCKSEAEVRKLLADRHSEHYWDMLKKYRDPLEDL